MMRLRYRSAARTHPGLVRAVNEDSVLARDDLGLWLVADGMGGHENGQWASQTLVAHFAALEAGSYAADKARAVNGALDAGNATIVRAAQAAGVQMGTTAVLFYVDASQGSAVWVGDSRLYRYRRGSLEQLSRDHTVVQELVDRGSLTADEAEQHPMSHVLSRAVGTEAQLRSDIRTEALEPGDHYLVCSDGLTKVVPDSAIAEALAIPNIGIAADRLLKETLDRGAPDNVTLIIVAVEEMTAVGGWAG